MAANIDALNFGGMDYLYRTWLKARIEERLGPSLREQIEKITHAINPASLDMRVYIQRKSDKAGLAFDIPRHVYDKHDKIDILDDKARAKIVLFLS